MKIEYRLVFEQGEWQLWPTTPEAYQYAVKNLLHGWVDGVQAGKDQHEVFTFRNSNAELPQVLEGLQTAGIGQAQVAIEGLHQPGNGVMAPSGPSGQAFKEGLVFWQKHRTVLVICSRYGSLIRP